METPRVDVSPSVGWDDSVVMGHYGEHFRTNRRFMKKGLGQAAVQNFVPMLERECTKFLGAIEKTPEQFPQHFRE